MPHTDEQEITCSDYTSRLHTHNPQRTSICNKIIIITMMNGYRMMNVPALDQHVHVCVNLHQYQLKIE